MAQLDTSHSRKNSGYKFKRSGKTPLVDFTPMVDLAFLLISFFMLTTAMTKPNIMELNMPENSDEAAISPERLITLISDSNNELFYYNGGDISNLHKTNYTENGIRTLMYNNIDRVNKLFGGNKHLICIIKFTDGASYENMVNLLDEMEITNVLTYAIQDLTDDEKEQLLIQQLK